MCYVQSLYACRPENPLCSKHMQGLSTHHRSFKRNTYFLSRTAPAWCQILHASEGRLGPPAKFNAPPSLLRSDRGTVFIVVEGGCGCTDPGYVFLSFFRIKIDLRHNHLLVFFTIIAIICTKEFPQPLLKLWGSESRGTGEPSIGDG